jgi:hypothetical protein
MNNTVVHSTTASTLQQKRDTIHTVLCDITNHNTFNNSKKRKYNNSNRIASQKNYDDLSSTQRYTRRKQARIALDIIKIPLHALTSTVAVSDVVHLSTATRKQLRTVSSINIPSESTICVYKKYLAVAAATATATFKHKWIDGAFIVDPISYINNIADKSSYVCIGGDYGGGVSKIGITYINHNYNISFAPLIAYDGKDDWLDLETLIPSNANNTDKKITFNGASAAFNNIYDVLQYVINNSNKNVFLNGDWVFVNNILGLKSAAATHPCPICTVNKDKLLSVASYRINYTLSKHDIATPLLTIDSSRIVPTPLHVLLGVCNRIITDVLKADNSMYNTIHTAGCGGKSDVFGYVGPEINKYLRANETSDNILINWMIKLERYLLCALTWNDNDITAFENVVNDVKTNWVKHTNINPFPKLHMLLHGPQFARKWHILGYVAESRLEALHAVFNELYHRHHFNKSHDEGERIRRCLADIAVKKVVNK